MQVESERRYHFAADPDAVWRVLTEVEHYRSWWPWLRQFDARALAAGETWTCMLRSPLRSTLRFAITLDEVIAPSRVAASLAGDLDGTASILIGPRRGGCEVRLESSLAPHARSLRLVSGLAPPLTRWAHDRVIDTAADQFRRQAVACRSTIDPPRC